MFIFYYESSLGLLYNSLESPMESLQLFHLSRVSIFPWVFIQVRWLNSGELQRMEKISAKDCTNPEVASDEMFTWQTQCFATKKNDETFFFFFPFFPQWDKPIVHLLLNLSQTRWWALANTQKSALPLPISAVRKAARCRGTARRALLHPKQRTPYPPHRFPPSLFQRDQIFYRVSWIFFFPPG